MRLRNYPVNDFAVYVRLTLSYSGLETTATEPLRHGMAIMISPITTTLTHGRTTKITTLPHNRGFQQSSAALVGQKSRNRLIYFLCIFRMTFL